MIGRLAPRRRIRRRRLRNHGLLSRPSPLCRHHYQRSASRTVSSTSAPSASFASSASTLGIRTPRLLPHFRTVVRTTDTSASSVYTEDSSITVGRPHLEPPSQGNRGAAQQPPRVVLPHHSGLRSVLPSVCRWLLSALLLAHQPPIRSSITGTVLHMMRMSSRRLCRRMYSRSYLTLRRTSSSVWS